jgi:hypothetical protein
VRQSSLTLTMLLAGNVLAGGVIAAQPANMAHVHIGHVTDSFKDTPKQQGLLPTAQAEAQIAQQHAALAMKSPDNLDSLKLHAGHVLHAIDPSAVEKGPGLGYGLKKAAQGAASHIQLAARAEGASQNVKTHEAHVSASLNNVIKRADAMADLAQRIRASSSAAEAATLAGQLNTLAEQVIKGVDANADGRITWEVGEGGLDQAQQHMALMKKAEGIE